MRWCHVLDTLSLLSTIVEHWFKFFRVRTNTWLDARGARVDACGALPLLRTYYRMKILSYVLITGQQSYGNMHCYMLCLALFHLNAHSCRIYIARDRSSFSASDHGACAFPACAISCIRRDARDVTVQVGLNLARRRWFSWKSVAINILIGKKSGNEK